MVEVKSQTLDGWHNHRCERTGGRGEGGMKTSLNGDLVGALGLGFLAETGPWGRGGGQWLAKKPTHAKQYDATAHRGGLNEQRETGRTLGDNRGVNCAEL